MVVDLLHELMEAVTYVDVISVIGLPTNLPLACKVLTGGDSRAEAITEVAHKPARIHISVAAVLVRTSLSRCKQTRHICYTERSLVTRSNIFHYKY